MNFTEPNPPQWLRRLGGNAQTLYAKSLQRTAPDYRRELLRDSYQTDYIACDFVDASDTDAPCVVLLHGLEGSSRSHYAVELMHAVQQHGWHGVVVHFRSCGGVPSKRLYHSGDTRELAYILPILAERYRTIYVVGVSMGGNVLAKYLGEYATDAVPHVAATVSTPFNLLASSRALEHGLPRMLYTPYFLHSLLPKVPPTTQKFRNLGEFDDAFTAPIHGFINKDDYYTRAASFPFLSAITVPTLLINAQNDPFVPPFSLPRAQDISGSITLLQPKHGGHAAFVSGNGRGHLRWLPETLLAWFESFQAA